jgi:hypothetical protein
VRWARSGIFDRARQNKKGRFLQDKYVADVGDWGKYGLLRALARGVSLGIIWYLVPDDNRCKDGRYIQYLKQPDKFRQPDQKLFDALAGLVPDRRSVADVESSGILPSGTRFFSERLVLKDISAFSMRGRQERIARRSEWFSRAIAKVRDCGIVLVDPDNGVECASVEPCASNGPKYIAWNELLELARGRQTLIVYHHLNRAQKGVDHPCQIRALVARLKDALRDRDLIGLRFKPFQSRAYIIAQPMDDPWMIRPKLDEFLASTWGREMYFERVV